MEGLKKDSNGLTILKKENKGTSNRVHDGKGMKGYPEGTLQKII